MAKATPAKKRGSGTDAVALLKQDHREVADLIDQVEYAEGEELEGIAERMCQLLTVHAQIEEEILYPAAREALEDGDLVAEANVEHASAKDLIAKIEAMSADDEEYKATVTVLGEYVKHHVKEEEGEMFPELKKSELDLQEIGDSLAARKLELMQELGIEEEPDTQTQRRAAAGARSKGKRSNTGSRATASSYWSTATTATRSGRCRSVRGAYSTRLTPRCCSMSGLFPFRPATGSRRRWTPWKPPVGRIPPL